MITVEIDTLTPCLIDNNTGEIVETEAVEIKRKSFLSKYNVNTGWYVNWTDLLIENQVYALVIKGTVSIQGLIAVRKDSTMKSAFITWMVAAPNNIFNAEPICMLHEYQIFIPEIEGQRIKEVYTYDWTDECL